MTTDKDLHYFKEICESQKASAIKFSQKPQSDFCLVYSGVPLNVITVTISNFPQFLSVPQHTAGPNLNLYL